MAFPAALSVAVAAISDFLPALVRSEEHTSELQSRQYLNSFPTRRSSDLYDTLPEHKETIDRIMQARRLEKRLGIKTKTPALLLLTYVLPILILLIWLFLLLSLLQWLP